MKKIIKRGNNYNPHNDYYCLIMIKMWVYREAQLGLVYQVRVLELNKLSFESRLCELSLSIIPMKE